MATTIPADRDPGAHLESRRFPLPGYGTEIGPIGHLHTERAALAAMTWSHFDVAPVGATIGAELHGIDLGRELDDDTIADIRRALLAYKVIFFRDQDITSAQHVAFARRFGELEIHPFIPANPDHPELVRFEKSADVGGYENAWHSDVSWRETPSMGAILHAISVPASGGDTLFADMAAAYDGLPEPLRAEADELVAIHDFTQAFGHDLDADGLAAMRAQHPPAHHPVIRTHPETGRRLIYVNRLFVAEVVGRNADETHALVDRLCRPADVPEYQCRFRWTPGAVAFWDNRAVQHYACSDYWPDIRIMERASIVGDRPR